MPNGPLFTGIYPALVSPVTSNWEVMEDELRSLVRHFTTTRVRGLYVCGGTGEGILLPVDIRKKILEIVVDEVRTCESANRLQVIAHIGSAETLNTQELVFHAASVGADAISTIPPMYYTYSRERIMAYYAWVAQLSALPLIIYAAAQSGVSFTAEMLKELSEYPCIRGIKFTGYNFYELMRMRSVVNDDFSILNGADEALLFGLLAGADGGIGATYSVMPELFCRLQEAYENADISLAKSLQKKVNAVIDVMLQFPVIGAIKYMLEKQGFAVGETVFPDDPIEPSQKLQLMQKLEAIDWRELCR